MKAPFGGHILNERANAKKRLNKAISVFLKKDNGLLLDDISYIARYHVTAKKKSLSGSF